MQDDGTRFNPIRDLTSVSDDDERQLGMDFDRELQKHVRVIYDPVVAGYLNDLGQKIVRQIEPQPFIYRFRVIDDPSLNAFAVPGGYVYFHSGTLLAAGSEGELAGVMGHEIAHVKARHYARMQKASQLPDILAGIAGMAAAVATGEPGILVATQAANVAMKLHFSREYETEADELGTIFMTRAGFPPAAITRFFERILAEQRATPDRIPPYLFTHPDVQDRIAAVTAQAEKLHPVHRRRERAQRRCGAARGADAPGAPDRRPAPHPARPTVPRPRRSPTLCSPRPSGSPPQVEQDAALLQLARAEASEPDDPRVPFRVGELLAEQGRHAEAAEAYRRTVRLDPTRALVFFKLGLAYRQIGERHRAVYAFEQASLRAGPGNVLQRRADWEVEKLTFAIVSESGVAAGDPLDSDQRPVPQPGAELRRRHASHRLVGAARQPLRPLQRPDPRALAGAGRPRGAGREGRAPAQTLRRIRARVRRRGRSPAGTWTVEASIDDDVIDSQRFEIR